MRIPRRRLHLRMPEQLGDHGQSLSSSNSSRRESVPQVMDANVLESSACSDTLPKWLEIGEPGTGLHPHDHPGVLLDTLDLPQLLDRGLAQMDDLSARLGVRQPQRLASDIHMLPLERHDFIEAAASQDQQAGGDNG